MRLFKHGKSALLLLKNTFLKVRAQYLSYFEKLSTAVRPVVVAQSWVNLVTCILLQV